jgi:flagellar basal body P-ring formation protein FlgA
MRPATAVLLSILFSASSSAPAACIEVPSNTIRAQDLAPAVPWFQALDPQAIIAFAPFPGTERVISSHDLVLLARRYGLVLSDQDPIAPLCVERIVHPLTLEEVTGALRSALDSQQARLEILDFTNKPVPSGRLVFQFAAINRPPANDPQAPVIWTGKLIYDAGASLAVWAKVRISVEREVLVAAHNIAKGELLTAHEISISRMAQFPAKEYPPSDTSAIAGKIARRPIAAGQRILPEMLEQATDVRGGETVHVKVVDGAATIMLDAVAQSSGMKGQSVIVHNPLSGKNFRAVIEGPSQVLVTPGPAAPVSRSSASGSSSNL